jgi:hypothetical protein
MNVEILSLGIFVSKFSILVLCSVSKNYALSRRKLTSAEVGGAGVDEPVLGIQHEILPGLLLHAVSNGLKHIWLIANSFFLIHGNLGKKILTITIPIFKLDVRQTGLRARVFTKI